jgi:hypothetical protein
MVSWAAVGLIACIKIIEIGNKFMSKTFTNALVFDKENIGIDPKIRNSLRTYYQRNLYMDKVDKNPPSSIIDINEDNCLIRADIENFDFVILTWEGNMIDIHNYHEACVHYINELDEKTQGDWLVAGQIIDQQANRKLYKDPKADHWKDSFWLFPITAVVNLKKWRELGSPAWGQQDGQQTVIKAVASEESVHDGYTPLQLSPGTEQISVNVKKGWGIINASLSAGIPVYNLNNNIRNCQNYLYPEVNVDRYNGFWQSMHSMPKLTDQYKKVLDKIITSKYPQRIDTRTWQCFIKNTEDYFPRPEQPQVDLASVDTMILPCSGFKDFIISMAKTTNRKTVSVIHYDIIKECVDIRKKIINRWDGTRSEFTPVLEGIAKEYRKDVAMVYHMHSMQSVEEVYDFMLTFFNDEEDLYNCWQKFKHFDHKFLEADMLDDPYNVLNQVTGKNIYLCLSDIAGWRNNIISYGYQNLRNNILKCLFSIRKKELNCIVDYKDPATDLQVWQDLDTAINHLKSEPEMPAIPDISWYTSRN